MAVFIFGAGATRGCSFVDPAKDPCLPPLDADFFTHLQRVQNPKHQSLIEDVMRDVVELFGQNFDVTMETVFSTLEHTLRMLSTTGESRDFKRKELIEKRDRLKQAIAVVLEDSLTKRSDGGASSQKPRRCEYHERFVKRQLRVGDAIITFNYDCVLDYSLKMAGVGKWNAQYGYRLPLQGYAAWQPTVRARGRKTGKKTGRTGKRTVYLYKLHGSLHFKEGKTVRLKQRPYTRQAGDLHFTILPPESEKAYDKGIFRDLWKSAGGAIHRARHIVVVGYSLPLTDLHSTALLRTSVKRRALKSLVIVNPDREARHRIRSVLQRGLSPETRVLSFDYLHEFVAGARRVASRVMWKKRNGAFFRVDEVHDQPAAWQGGHRRNAPWARVSGSQELRMSPSGSHWAS